MRPIGITVVQKFTEESAVKLPAADSNKDVDSSSYTSAYSYGGHFF